MTHVRANVKKLRSRVRRIAGQVQALEAALLDEADCADVLMQIAAVRGAVHGLMMEVLQAHLREHVAEEPDARTRDREVEQVADLLRRYLK
jgi:FrmR/RcnR family transcriptional regulator, repressor of rcnA expression